MNRRRQHLINEIADRVFTYLLLEQESDKSKIKPGVAELFESNPELAKIGTEQQYSQYLDTIFPNSKIKDIVYHGTPAEFEKFKPMKPNFTTLNSIEGIYNFSTNKEFTKRYGKRTVRAILDIRKPFKNTESGEYVDDMDRPLSNALFKIGKQEGNMFAPPYDDSLKDTDAFINSITGEHYIAKHPVSGIEIGIPKQDIVTVFDSEQIHILGSKQDIKGFKDYVKKN